MMDWRTVDLCGASCLSHVVGEYEIIAPYVPRAGRFRLKVYEHMGGSFAAVSNLHVRAADGGFDYIGAGGNTEVEAIEDFLRQFMESIRGRVLSDDDCEWSDPVEF